MLTRVRCGENAIPLKIPLNPELSHGCQLDGTLPVKYVLSKNLYESALEVANSSSVYQFFMDVGLSMEGLCSRSIDIYIG